MIDIIRDGVRAADLRAHGDRAVWDALGVTALAALNAGWSRPQWESEVLDPRSILGFQVRVDRRDRVRSRRAVSRMLNSAWDRAAARAEESPCWDAATARNEAEKRALLMRDLAADVDAPLSEPQRRILVHVAEMAERHGSTVVNLPRREVQAATSLGERAARYNLDRLADRGLLVLVERGRPRGGAAKAPARANAYRLPDAEEISTYLSRETRQVGPNALTGGTHDGNEAGTRALTGGTHYEEDPMDSITLTREQIVAALGETALARLLAQSAVEEHVGDVRPLRAIGEDGLR